MNKQLVIVILNQLVCFQDKYKRALADGENLRNRLTKQIQEARIFGIQSFCKDLLDVADVLNKATETVPKEEISEKNPHLKSLYEGLLLTESQLKSVFKRHGLEAVNPLNEKFNPNFHEALFQQVSLNIFKQHFELIEVQLYALFLFSFSENFRMNLICVSKTLNCGKFVFLVKMTNIFIQRKF